MKTALRNTGNVLSDLLLLLVPIDLFRLDCYIKWVLHGEKNLYFNFNFACSVKHSLIVQILSLFNQLVRKL